MRALNDPVRFFKSWAEGVDEKKLWWIAGGVIVGVVLLQWQSQPWTLRAVLASTAIATGFYKGGRSQTIKSWMKTWFSVLVTLSFFHAAHVWLGNGWIGILLLFLFSIGYKAYRMRTWVRLWWKWYRGRLKAAWRGER